ncbi:MAG: Aspartate-semialdehyde dehydrogenase [Elusimicrobia bacterium]|nr:Aspartate-semialdehyde dehydrogenase [Elusimicrobiota bacterium]
MTVGTAVNKKTYNVAVVGATGAVGLEMVRMLENRKFPIKSLRLFASEKSAGRKIKFNKKQVCVEILDSELLSGLDVAIFSAGATVSKEFAPIFAEKGIFVIDNSSAWRMDPEIPLVVPEVNPHALAREKKIIANPNCSTIQMVVALKPIHDAVKIKTIRVATYQAVSGAGAKGIHELENQSKAWASGKKIPPSAKFPHQIGFNLIPQIDVFTDNGYTKEEMKMVNETRKIMESPEMEISATCVRVPVFRSHSEAVWIETENPISPQQARMLLSKAPGVVLQDEPEKSLYPMPLAAQDQQITYVGRIRQDLISPNGLSLWVVSDNLLKGAALNAVEIAELLVNQGIL